MASRHKSASPVPRAPAAPPTDFDALPPGAIVENIRSFACDGARSHGVLYRKGGERTVLCITHPRADLTRHYLTPSLLEAGFAVCGFTHRFGINDFALAHETMLLDISGVIASLRNERSFEKVVLLANSGGGGIFGLYQWQAEAIPPTRLTDTAAGDPLDLNSVELFPADGLILLATPFGESSVVARGIDPSVVDEADPLSCDPELDMYNPANGYCEPPEPSTFAAEFVERYRAAQAVRMARIDAHARWLISEQRRFQGKLASSAFAGLDPAEKSYIKRRSIDTKAVLVYRTDASLAFSDLSLFPSRRSVGSFLSADTLAMNYARGMIAQYKSPRAWLSASSSISSRSSLRLALPNIRAPTVIVNFTGDRGVYPQDAAEMLALSATSDKSLQEIDGDHFGFSLADPTEKDPRQVASREIGNWLQARFPAR